MAGDVTESDSEREEESLTCAVTSLLSCRILPHLFRGARRGRADFQLVRSLRYEAPRGRRRPRELALHPCGAAHEGGTASRSAGI
jgi:hypothetical protein